MNKELKYLILFSLLTLFGCGNEEDAVSGIVPPQAGETLQLTVTAADFVTDGAPDTRATDNGNKTNFEKGDRVGVIILDAGDNLIYDNIPYKYDSSNKKWVFDDGDGKGGCYYDPKAETYIVYYPYSRAADRVRGVDELKTKFAPKFNQSDIKDYRSSDLMVWDRTGHLASSVTTLDAKLEHAFASVYLTPTAYTLDDGNGTKGNIKVSDVNLTIGDNVYVPYQTTDGSLRCIIPASITPSGIRCFYTFNGTTYGNKINISGKVAANTRYTSAPEIISGEYTLDDAKVGDFYCKRSDGNGYLIPSEVVLTGDKKNACLGIVMKVGKDAADPWKDDCEYKLKNSTTPMTTIHGYVLALYDANGGSTCQWGSYGTSVPTDKEQKTGFYGYKNTQAITSKGGSDLSTAFPATYHTTTDYDGEHPAPGNSSGWFLPSAGQCWYWYQNREAIWTSMNKAGGDGWSDYYWSSSEGRNLPTSVAWCVSFDLGYVYGDYKNYSSYVRSCLAF